MKRKGAKNRLWDWMAFFYDQFYQRFSPYLRLHQEILNNVESSSPGVGCILDAGCGTGLLSMGLARRGYPVVGVDRSGPMLKRGELRRRNEKVENVTFLKADLNRGIQALSPFRRIYFIHSLYLMENPEETLRNLSSHLVAGGEVVMCNPTRKLTREELWAAGHSVVLASMRKEGILSVSKLLGIVLAMGFFNVIIQRRKNRCYHCWNKEELEELLRSCNLKMRWVKKSCLADSHLLVCAEMGNK